MSEAEVALWADWLRALQCIPNNPHGAEIGTFGGATALSARHVPLTLYNRVIGLGPRDMDRFDEIVDFYDTRGVRWRIDVNPFDSTPEQLERLIGAGLRPVSFQTNLFGEPRARPPRRPAGVVVRQIRPHELDFFARLYDEAYYDSVEARRRAQKPRLASIKARFQRPGWRFYLTFVNGIPAGGGGLFVKDGVGSLAGGATIFTLRGRGCQSALLHKRIADAARLGCDLVVGRCVIGTASQRNMEKAGLRTAYTKVIWERP